MLFIKKIKLINFKRFRAFEVEFDPELNLFIGDNESGKSSILLAIDLVLSGSRNKIDTLGLESLFNQEAVQVFLNSSKEYDRLPQIFIELYLSDQLCPGLNGKYNSDQTESNGLKMIIEPNDELSQGIVDILNQENNFPYEYYITTYKTFSGENYSSYKKYLRHILIDNSQINSEYASKEYVKGLYNNYADKPDQIKYQNTYRKLKEEFTNNSLSDLNSKIGNYKFTVRNNSKSNLETDLTLSEDDIYLENKGKGKQCFIKTEFSLQKGKGNIDVVLLEEPENHLSHLYMKQLINKIQSVEERQLFITSHNDLIAARLDLRKAILLNSNSEEALLLKELGDDSTAEYFMKAPNNNLLEFILSKKVLLVEGPAEYILMKTFFETVSGSKLSDSNVHIISVNGTSFKRYLKIAKYLKIKTAVIRDNDGESQRLCIDNYVDYICETIKIFFDADNSRETFEKCIFYHNQNICEEIFPPSNSQQSPLDYMLKHKTECSFELLSKKSNQLTVPTYIEEAIKWISD